jgi:hypothetical protein
VASAKRSRILTNFSGVFSHWSLHSSAWYLEVQAKIQRDLAQGILFSFGFHNYKKEESVLFFENLKKEKTENKKKEIPLIQVNSLQSLIFESI